jgi:hypothetical protein
MPQDNDHCLTPEELPLGFDLIIETGGNLAEARRLTITIRKARPAYIVRLGPNRFSVWASSPEEWPPPHRPQPSPMNITTTDTPLPAPIAKQLSDLEARHKAHQAMLNRHHEDKHDRREEHRARKFRRSVPPILLL